MVREGEKRGEKSGKNPAAMRYRGEIADLYYQSTASRPLPNSSLSHLRLTVPRIYYRILDYESPTADL